MSFFASGGWRSSTISHETTTTNPILTSGQVSISESMSGDATERKLLSGALKGPLVGISGRNGSQVSIPNPDPNPSGKKLTFRGVARALYFIGSTISANAPSPPVQHETAVYSSSPHAAGTLVPPMERSTLSREVPPLVDDTSDHLRSPISDGSGESIEDADGRPAAGR